MVTFRNNNNKKTFFRSNNNRRPSFRRNDEGSKFKPNFSNNDNFQRNISGRNNYNASKLIEKYNELAREALANEDKILSENYFQHADHFTRVLNEQEKNKTTVKTINIQSGKDVIEKPEESKKEDTTKDKNLTGEKQLATS
jgi:hypothetical protein|tara:strand:+ start:107 stop:529 length:423 start_codon:yes stop_codon:yes gene_type:complete